MNILIAGDSYGVPNYDYFCSGDGSHPDTHISFLLQQRGHTVHNVSINGGCPLQTLGRIQEYMQGVTIQGMAGGNKYTPLEITLDSHVEIDLLIWFQTGLLRDLDNVQVNIADANNHIANLAYQRLSNIVEELDCQLAVIGGAGTVLTQITDYVTPDYLLPDWKSEILQQDVPHVQSLGALDKLDAYAEKYGHSDFMDALLSDHEQLQSAMTDSDLFPDDSHPGDVSHAILMQLLNRHIKL